MLEGVDGFGVTFLTADAVEFIDEVPKTSVGKFSKKTLREKFGGYQVAAPAAASTTDDGRT